MRETTLEPTSATPHAQASSTGTADVKTLAAPVGASAVLLTVETTACYLVVDGTTPISTNGLFLPTGVVHRLDVKRDLKFASSAAAVSKVNALWLT